MQALIKKWGNSAAVRLPTSLLEASGLSLDAPVRLREENGSIIIEPAPADAVSLDVLLAAITPENLHAEVDSGAPMGDEAL